MLNTIVYCIPAGWVWGEHGFLFKLGVVDIAGSGPVHLVGGTSGENSSFILFGNVWKKIYVAEKFTHLTNRKFRKQSPQYFLCFRPFIFIVF